MAVRMHGCLAILGVVHIQAAHPGFGTIQVLFWVAAVHSSSLHLIAGAVLIYPCLQNK